MAGSVRALAHLAYLPYQVHLTVKVEATFVRSAAGADDFPADGLPEIALVGRSNVGKSSLINALVRLKIARTSGAPGKTRLANIYRVDGTSPFYLVDLPGYGYARAPRHARGGPGDAEERRRGAAREFEELTRAYFGRVGRVIPDRPDPFERVGALLLIDSRHPGLENDIEAWRWLKDAGPASVIVATKIDKLARGERIRAMRSAESVFEHPVLPVSAATGEGLDELWKLIDSLVNSRKAGEGSRRGSTPKETAPRRRTRP